MRGVRRGNRRHRLRQRRQRREHHLRVLLQPPPVPAVQMESAIKEHNPSTIYSTEYLVSYCYKNWHDWCVRAQNELARRQVETVRPYTQREEAAITNLQRFSDMMSQVRFGTYC